MTHPSADQYKAGIVTSGLINGCLYFDKKHRLNPTGTVFKKTAKFHSHPAL
jgi:hypothetical protein